jgi:hypothetical protein
MDRHWSARKSLQLHVTLELPRHTEPVIADLRDISLSGAYIETDSALPHSLPLMIELHLPDSRVYEGFRLQAERRAPGTLSFLEDFLEEITDRG